MTRQERSWQDAFATFDREGQNAGVREKQYDCKIAGRTAQLAAKVALGL